MSRSDLPNPSPKLDPWWNLPESEGSDLAEQFAKPDPQFSPDDSKWMDRARGLAKQASHLEVE